MKKRAQKKRAKQPPKKKEVAVDLPAQPPPPPPPPPPERPKPKGPLIKIASILPSQTIKLIKAQPGEILVRGLIRAAIKIVIPNELMGDAGKMIQFIEEEHTLREENKPRVTNNVSLLVDLYITERDGAYHHRNNHYQKVLAIPPEVIMAVMGDDSGAATRWIKDHANLILTGVLGQLTQITRGDRMEGTVVAKSLTDVRWGDAQIHYGDASDYGLQLFLRANYGKKS